MLPSRAITAAAAITLAGVGVFAWNHHRRTTSPPSSPALHPSSLTLPPSPAPLSPLVSTITRDGPATSYLKLTYQLRELGDTLSDADVAALCAFIEAPAPATFDEMEWGSIVNDIEEVLAVQRPVRPGVADSLSRIFRDVAKPMIQRDYAVQHIGGFAIYLLHTTPPDQPLPPVYHRLVAEMNHAVSDPTLTLTGTAFNLIGGILAAGDYRDRKTPGLDRAALAKKAAGFAARPDLPDNVRLPALEFVSRHPVEGDDTAARLARAALGDPASNILEIQSAAAVLARSGTTADIPALQSIAETSNPHTKTAALAAMQAIKGRE